MKSLPFYTAIVLALALMASPSLAQVLYGTVTGTVTDGTGASVAGAAVTLTNSATNQPRSAATNEAGVFLFPNVQSGPYDLRVVQDGFTEFVRRGVQVSINQVVRVDVPLQVGQVSESIVVDEQLTPLQMDRADVRSELGARSLEELPVPPGRNFQQLLSILPGFTPAQQTNSVAANPARSLAFNVNGSSRYGNNIKVDGVTTNGVWLPHITTYVPSLESIETVNVSTNSFDAEQGMAGGAAINLQIKSGTNELRGSMFEYHNNNATKAKPFFLPTGERNPKSIMNQYGGTVGGPIVKNRVFFFVAYEGTKDRQTGTSFASVPTLGMRTGDMSGSTRPIYDPGTGNPNGSGRLAFANNQIPLARISPITAKLTGLTPLPMYDNRLASNYFKGDPYKFDRNTMDLKLNWNVSANTFLYARYGFLQYHMDSPPIFGELGGPMTKSNSGFAGIAKGNTHSLSVGGTRVISPNLLFDGNFGYNLLDTDSQQIRMDEKLGLDFLGIPGTNGPRRFEGGWPQFAVSNFTTLGLNSTNWPIIWHDPAWQYSSNLNWTKQNHNFRFGFDVSRQHMNRIQYELGGGGGGAAGAFSFTGGVTNVLGGPSPNAYNSYSDFLLGSPFTVQKMLQVPDEITTRATVMGFYARDQWQINRKLTLSYGLRWEHFPVPTRKDRGLENYNPLTNQMMICGVGAQPMDCGVKVSKRNFAPRLGIAYRISSDTVIRAGYGITNDPYVLSRPMVTNYPALVALRLDGSNSFTSARPIEQGIPPLVAPDLGNGLIDVPGQFATNSMPEDFPRGYLQSWNLTLQRKVGLGFVAQAGYVATRQVRQLGFFDINAGRPGGGNASRPLFAKFGRTTSTRYVQPLGTGKYDALQASLSRSFSQGVQIGANYTWSKAIGICCNDNSDATPAIQLADYYNLNRSVTGYDRTHNLQVTGLVELPFGRGRRYLNSGGILSAITGGWQLNSVFSAFSGLPFSVSASGVSLNAPGNSQRADQVKPRVERFGKVGAGSAYYDPLAFAAVTDARFGTAGFNTLRGPGYIGVDGGLFRNFKVGERVGVQFRAEVFNLTNTPHFGNPGGNVSSMVRNADGTIRSLGGFMEVTTLGSTASARDGIDERLFRFGVRISF
ncbi:MAG: TonB-dependent receptor [Bryobacterales bacterium]|nr:TonB-dependent receptor [Bryobacterales bacterium]